MALHSDVVVVDVSALSVNDVHRADVCDQSRIRRDYRIEGARPFFSAGEC
jgi:hypothetical protein